MISTSLRGGWQRPALWSLCLSSALLLAACGGGGGGSSGPSSVSVGRASPASISGEVMVNERIPSVHLTGTLSGDVESLQGKPLYVVVEDPASLFESTATLMVLRQGVGYSYTLDLYPKPLPTAGHFTGNLRIHACLDNQCNQHLAGTPMAVPFDVTVLAGLTLSRNEVTLNVPFGTVPDPQAIDVAVSKYSTGWVANNTTPYVYGVPKTTSVLPAQGMLLTAPQLTLQWLPAPPGTHEETVKVQAQAVLPDNRHLSYEQSIAVHYTVTPNPAVDHVFWPAGGLVVQQSRTDKLIHEVSYGIVTNTGVTAALVGVEYLSHPAGSGPNAPVNSWWSEYPYREYHACVGIGASFDCLVPGVYAAQVRYRLTSAGGTRDVLYPITLTVTP
ncbi:hypothetical protein [Ideonella sp. BN130291]|uniref:hypothetical protein n=1 Tax=Ideonella sp. BN130291 TaxID=3112940 RepID=UPI002E252D79|nr:hypothetical protein [Ideonella sp. BN130291]